MLEFLAKNYKVGNSRSLNQNAVGVSWGSEPNWPRMGCMNSRAPHEGVSGLCVSCLWAWLSLSQTSVVCGFCNEERSRVYKLVLPLEWIGNDSYCARLNMTPMPFRVHMGIDNTWEIIPATYSCTFTAKRKALIQVRDGLLKDLT